MQEISLSLVTLTTLDLLSWEMIHIQEGFNDVKMFVSWVPLSVKAYVTLPSAGDFSPAQEMKKNLLYPDLWRSKSCSHITLN